VDNGHSAPMLVQRYRDGAGNTDEENFSIFSLV